MAVRRAESIQHVTIAWSPRFQIETLQQAHGRLWGTRAVSVQKLPTQAKEPCVGHRASLLEHQTDPPVTRLNVVLNWFDELKRRVPSR